MNDAYISLIENGKRTPSFEVLRGIAQALEVDAAWLQTGVSSVAALVIEERMQFATFAADHGDFDRCLAILQQLEGQAIGRELWPAERDRADWLRCRALQGAGRVGEAHEPAERILRRCLTGRSELPATEVANRLLTLVTDDPDQTVAAVEDACLLAEQALTAQVPRDAHWLDLAARVVHWRARTGRLSVAGEQARRWLAEAAQPDGPGEAHHGMVLQLAHVEAQLGLPEAALERLADLRTGGDPDVEIAYAKFLVLTRPERTQEATAVLHACRGPAMDTSARHLNWAVAQALVEVAAHRPGAAVALLRPVLDEPTAAPVPATAVEARLLAVAAWQAMDDRAAALQACQQTRDFLQALDGGHEVARAWRELGDRMDTLGAPFEDVLATYRAAIDTVGHVARPADAPPGGVLSLAGRS